MTLIRIKFLRLRTLSEEEEEEENDSFVLMKKTHVYRLVKTH